MPNGGHARQGGVGLRQSTDQPAEQRWEPRWATTGGGGGGKAGDQREHRAVLHALDAERGKRVTGIARCASTSGKEQAGTVHRPAAPSDHRLTAGELFRIRAKGRRGGGWNDMETVRGSAGRQAYQSAQRNPPRSVPG